MITHALTYQYESGQGDIGDAPDALVLTLFDGTLVKFVPEVVTPVFKPGQIVRVTSPGDYYHNRFGVIEVVETTNITVNFGGCQGFYPHPHPFLEIIHEV